MKIEQRETAPVLAAYRSPNFNDHAERRPLLRFHVVLDNGEPACGMAGGLYGEIWVAAYRPEPAELVPVGVRCQRSGCKERWPAPMAEVKGNE